MTKAAELRQKDVAGLEAEVKSLQKAHFGLRMQKATQQLGNTNTLRTTRRDIARAKTILAEKQAARSEEHTSELQSHLNLVCRLLLEKKKNIPRGRHGAQARPLPRTRHRSD